MTEKMTKKIMSNINHPNYMLHHKMIETKGDELKDIILNLSKDELIYHLYWAILGCQNWQECEKRSDDMSEVFGKFRKCMDKYG